MNKITTEELFAQLQSRVKLDLKENEILCPKCKGLRFYYIVENDIGYIENCRVCHTGKLYICEHCKETNKTNCCNCNAVREIRTKKAMDAHYEKAEKLTSEQYDGWVYAEGYGYQEGYFESVDDLIDHCEGEEIPVPDWVYCCKDVRHKIDVDSAIEYMLDDAFEDARDYLVDEEELYDFVDKWNAKQKVKSYYPDCKRVVILNTHWMALMKGI